jgi:CRISPR type IV-associated protein Csf2
MNHPHFFEGVITALEPISHSSGSNGITTEFRRERIVQTDGTPQMVPVLTGNAMRGMLRDAGMWHMCRSIGYGDIDEHGRPLGLSMAAFHMLFSGGSLGGATTQGLDVDFARQFRDLIPLLSVFGTAHGNQMLDGRCKIGFVQPICRETSHIIPPLWLWRSYPAVQSISIDLLGDETDETVFSNAWSLATGIPWSQSPVSISPSLCHEHYQRVISVLPSVYDLLDEIMYTRKDDEKNDRLRMMISGDVRKLLDEERRQKAAKKAQKGQQDVGQHQQMRYYTEVLSPGTKMYWYLQIDGDATDIEYQAFMTSLETWAMSPYIGGKSGTGHGKVAIDLDRWRLHPIGTDYNRHLELKAEEIRQALNCIR